MYSIRCMGVDTVGVNPEDIFISSMDLFEQNGYLKILIGVFG